MNGKDWDAIGDAYAPLFLQIEDTSEIYDLTSEMVDELGDDEVRFISSFDIERLPPEEQDYVGIGALVDISSAEETGAGPHILYLFPDSGAAAAGLQIRDRIVSVDGDPCVTIRRSAAPKGATRSPWAWRRPGRACARSSWSAGASTPPSTPISSTLGPDGSVGYLRLPSMEGQNTIDGMTAVLEDFRTRALKALVIDVRSVATSAPWA